MKQLLIFILIVLIGCLIAGLYGILHDQLTYSISHEYYTKFKFEQFGLNYEGSEDLFKHDRYKVAVVGLFATWWMGIPISITVGLFSIHREPPFMFTTAMKAFLITIIIAFATGLFGLILGFIEFTNHANNPRLYFGSRFLPENLVDFKHFVAVGSMHNYSYLGGVIGLAVGVIFILWRKRKYKLTYR